MAFRQVETAITQFVFKTKDFVQMFPSIGSNRPQTRNKTSDFTQLALWSASSPSINPVDYKR